MKRKRDDSAGPGRGELGQYIDHPRVTRRGNTGWSDEGKGTSPKGQGAYSPDSDGALRDGPQDVQFAWSTRQIWQDVEANQRPNGEFDSTGPIKAGVNRKQ